MTNMDSAVTAVQFDVSGAAENVKEIDKALTALKTISTNTFRAIANAFSPVLKCMQNIETQVQSIAEAMGKSAEKISNVKNAAESAESSGNFFTGFAEGIDQVLQGIDKVKDIESDSGKLYKTFAEIATAPDLATVGKALMPNTLDVVDAASDAALGGLGKFSQIITSFSPKLGGAMDGMVASITTAFSKVGTVLGGMGGSWAFVIAAIVAGVALIIQNWDTIKAVIMSLWGEYLQPLWEYISIFIQSISENLTIIWETVLKPLIDGIIQVFWPNRYFSAECNQVCF